MASPTCPTQSSCEIMSCHIALCMQDIFLLQTQLLDQVTAEVAEWQPVHALFTSWILCGELSPACHILYFSAEAVRYARAENKLHMTS